MRSTLKNTGLLAVGLVAGAAATMQFSALAYKPVEPSMPLDQLQQLSRVVDLIRSDYVEPVDSGKLLTDAISGMVDSLDPHSAYLDASAYRELREGTEGKFVGLGIEISQSDGGYIEIVTPMEDSPAERAGIRAGDLITRIEGVDVRSLALDEAVKRMRGTPGTRVRLTIARATAPQPLVLTVERQEIVQKSVKAKIVEPGYGWLRIAQFQEPTVDDMAAKLAELARKEPQLKGLVLDLRNDPGGLLQGAIGVAAAFLPEGAEIVSTNGQLVEMRQRYYGRPQDYMLRSGRDPLSAVPASFKSLPLVVLVNTGSASASEIVAGALQDHKRATIVGTPTFGKGSVQTIRPVGREAAVKLTTARYFTPNGRSIQARGIVPDLAVDENADNDGLNALRLREADLQHHLSGDGAEQKTRPDDIEEQMALLDAARDRKPLAYGGSDDFQLAQAVKHLKGQPMQLSKRQAQTKLAGHKP
ncbi:S41 family peptidase [Massilia sp. Dwa41.01b]|uniref:S41 family peptidase n=1 Tax=unclassified Massilia TaxID=2609279 RepID=UPI0016021401|nr:MULTISPECIES: S41 family peptidase [unclassified Massilia]QNA90843.1 S41 family peptidase [Massilia sp. Dwa41.01b]QNA98084.1 S41 family peptidase [Massilia sp. Se16.2.3]